MFDELADAGVFSLLADGFGVGRRVVVFEQLGRALRARARSSASLPARATAGIVGVVDADGAHRVGRAPRRARRRCVVLDGAGGRVDPRRSTRRAVAVAARSAHAGRARRRAARRASTVDADVGAARRAGAVLTAAFQLGLADRLHRARGRVRQGARAVRPADRLVPGDQAHARRHARAHRGRARRGVRGGRAPRRPRASPTSTARSPAPSCSRARPRSRTARPRRRCTAAWASRGRSTCTST